MEFTPYPSSIFFKTKIKFSFRINKVCANNIEDKKIHQLTTHIWLHKFASITNNKECKFLPPKFLPSFSLYITIRKEDKNFRYDETLYEIFSSLPVYLDN